MMKKTDGVCGASTVYTPEFCYGDALPNAPALAPRGEYAVGVRTVELVNRGAPCAIEWILNDDIEAEVPRCDRSLSCEVWYPARLRPGEEERCVYDRDSLGREHIVPARVLSRYAVNGRAARGAEPVVGGRFPLILYAHGDPGFSTMLSYMGENLASKGYVFAAIDFTDSRHDDIRSNLCAYANRGDDIEFVIRAFAREDAALGPLAQIADAETVGLIGYSMGGHGVLNVAGAGYVTDFAPMLRLAPHRMRGSEWYEHSGERCDIRRRVKAVIAASPYVTDVVRDESVRAIRCPVLFLTGAKDEVAFAENTQARFRAAENCERYLLVYRNARHNIIVNPAPDAALSKEGVHPAEITHYHETCWEQGRLNNINQHFATAFFGKYLKADARLGAYLDLPEGVSNACAWAGFREGSNLGMAFYHLEEGVRG